MNTLTPSNAPESAGSAPSAKRLLLVFGLAFLIWAPLITYLDAWVVTIFWGWFIVPQFRAALLPLPVAAGLDIMFRFVTFKSDSSAFSAGAAKEKNRELTWSERLSRMFVPNLGLSLLRVGITLLFGWIVHLFVQH